MKLSTIFEKPIDRPIEGVIKADDDSGLRNEIEEYVITNEVSKRMENLFDAYNNYEGNNGVWISGFFGTGKSHLLKMLAMLLENRQVDNVSCVEMFLKKCENNEFLKSGLKKAVSIPSTSIIFNIDQKSDAISKKQFDAILAVFVKVFDDMCGYYGKRGHIAHFERDLDTRGQLQKFKTAYEKIAGFSWEVGREQANMESSNIESAYSEVSGKSLESVKSIISNYRKDYKVSIEDFAEEVNKFILKQEKNFRLNFFVDEVGQYIADNVKLMTNLQTIAESLATKCNGRAWIIVTAQEDMDNIVGEMGKHQSNDFTKIQARFHTRMKLTGSNVDEVIQKRLLKKNDQGTQCLSKIYKAQSNNFKTLFDFADGAHTFRNFKDKDHFIFCYPFIPYQFSLFQLAIQNLSDRSAFEGKNASVAERSMLGVFQEVANMIYDKNIGTLATFDMMFEGISKVVKASIQRTIFIADGNLENKFAIRVLKALFLVKYVKGFKETIRNLCVLMLERFDQNPKELKENVVEALNLLEQQTYIQRNGDIYEFLTDEEKEVEQEIKNTEVDDSQILEELGKVIFDQVIKNTKIRHDKNGQDYGFTKKLDDRPLSREHELTIHVISPFNPNSGNEEILKMQSAGRDELLVIMPSDDRLIRDVLMYKRTQKFVKQNFSITQKSNVKRILGEKQANNTERLKDIKTNVIRLLGLSKMFTVGGEIESTSEDPQKRIITGFYDLIVRTYPNLGMLKNNVMSEKDVSKILKSDGNKLFGDVMSESEQEVFSHIISEKKKALRTSLKTLLEKFEKKPYGWPYAAILCVVANLSVAEKLEIHKGNILDGKEIETALLNTQSHANVFLIPQIEFTTSQIRGLKDFYNDFFNTPAPSNEARALGTATGQAFKDMLKKLCTLQESINDYPFVRALDDSISRLRDVVDKNYSYYLTEINKFEDDLHELKEQVIDPILTFMSNTGQKDIYNNAKKFLQTQDANLSYIKSEITNELKLLIDSSDCYAGGKMSKVKKVQTELKNIIDEKLLEEKQNAMTAIEELEKKLSSVDEFKKLSASKQTQLLNPYEERKNLLDGQKLIAVIKDTVRLFKEEEYPGSLALLEQFSKPEPKSIKPEKTVDKGDDGDEETDDYEEDDYVEPPVEPTVVVNDFVAITSIKIDYAKPWLADESDVDSYLQVKKKALMAELDGKENSCLISIIKIGI